MVMCTMSSSGDPRFAMAVFRCVAHMVLACMYPVHLDGWLHEYLGTLGVRWLTQSLQLTLSQAIICYQIDLIRCI